MSAVKKLFNKNEKVPTVEESIQKLMNMEDLLTKRTEVLEKKIEEQTLLAKQYCKTNKKFAIKALKAKKRFERQLTETDGTLTSLEYQRESLQNAKTNAEVLKVMGNAAKAFKDINQGWDIDKVDELKDQIADQYDLIKTIGEAISSQNNEYDEDDLLAELNELVEENVDEELETIPDAHDEELVEEKEKPTKEKEKAKIAETA